MKTARICWVMMVAAALLRSVAHGQTTTDEPVYPAPSPLAPHLAVPRPDKDVTEVSPTSGGGLSDWIVYRRDFAAGKHDAYTPLYTEFYVNLGPSFPVGGNRLSRELQTGITASGGLRALFFNEPLTRAWVADVHLIHTHETAGPLQTPFEVTVFRNNTKFEFGKNGLPRATVKAFQRTSFGVGMGREWYLLRPADADGLRWRVGVDAGGRYGSSRVVLRPKEHLSDVIGSFYTSIHTDLEFPFKTCLLHIGFRVEWAYTWSDVLQRKSDEQDVSLLGSVGIRY